MILSFLREFNLYHQKDLESSDDLQAITTKKAFDAAPKSKSSKARYKDLEGGNIYDRYFHEQK